MPLAWRRLTELLSQSCRRDSPGRRRRVSVANWAAMTKKEKPLQEDCGKGCLGKREGTSPRFLSCLSTGSEGGYGTGTLINVCRCCLKLLKY